MGRDVPCESTNLRNAMLIDVSLDAHRRQETVSRSVRAIVERRRSAEPETSLVLQDGADQSRGVLVITAERLVGSDRWCPFGVIVNNDC